MGPLNLSQSYDLYNKKINRVLLHPSLFHPPLSPTLGNITVNLSVSRNSPIVRNHLPIVSNCSESVYYFTPVLPSASYMSLSASNNCLKAAARATRFASTTNTGFFCRRYEVHDDNKLFIPSRLFLHQPIKSPSLEVLLKGSL